VIAFWIFLGFALGVASTILTGIAILNRPLPERERPVYSAISNGRARTTGREDLFEAIARRLQ
jgi:hypothetical protein